MNSPSSQNNYRTAVPHSLPQHSLPQPARSQPWLKFSEMLFQSSAKCPGNHEGELLMNDCREGGAPSTPSTHQQRVQRAQVLAVVEEVLQHGLHGFILWEMLQQTTQGCLNHLILTSNHFTLTWKNNRSIYVLKSSAYTWQYNFHVQPQLSGLSCDNFTFRFQ